MRNCDLPYMLLLLCFASIFLSSCETIEELRKEDTLNRIGSFRLNPVAAGEYWYDGKEYEYNQYEIEIVSKPCKAHVIMEGKYIGDTPFIYKYTGRLYKDEYVTFRAIPLDDSYKQQEASLRIRTELPKKIEFTFNR